jgi:hypothetical protein
MEFEPLDLMWNVLSQEFPGGVILNDCTFRCCRPFSRTNKKPLERRPFHLCYFFLIFVSLAFIHHITTIAHHIVSLKYLAHTLLVIIVFCATLVIFPILGFMFCVCLVLPPCPLLQVKECEANASNCSKFSFFI